MKYSIRYKIAKALKDVGIKPDASKCSAVAEMKETIEGLSGGSIQFTITREPNGEWVAESVNIAGIITGGFAEDDPAKMIKDAIFTYFAIPPEYCHDELIREAGEPSVIKQELYAMA